MKTGPTRVEAIVIILLLAAIGALFWSQQQAVQVRHKDSQRKEAINATYYYLEDVYYTQHHGYPVSLGEGALKGLPLSALQDPEGHAINDPSGDLRYDPSGCQNGLCTSYTLSAQLQKEAAFTKESLHHS
jgi:type II secretory pathway pseudopilin PulG